MKGDFTRWTFRQQQHYHGVLKQQGRVDLDADWNEQGAITTHHIETEALDEIGAAGAPEGDAGFMIQAVNNGQNLSISAGRAYVDGILCENEQANLLITAQPDLPGFSLPTTVPGTYIAYLRVWERHVTLLDDPGIMEVALGGPDTCTRAKTVWQVKLLFVGNRFGDTTCSTNVAAYNDLIAPGSGTLKAQVQSTTTTDPCSVPSVGGYRSLENQLYRVEIHNSGNDGTATFKWSRDNGSVVASWIAPPSDQNPGPNTLFVSSPGKDSVLGFAPGQWVELSDDARELDFQPGTLVQLVQVQGQVLTVDPTTVIPAGGSLNLSDYKVNPKVRRWDSAKTVPVTTGSWLSLENGVQVQFAAGSYNTGDYWLIPARTLTGNIDWPVDSSGSPVAEPPKGIRRHYCRLAIVQLGDFWSRVASCLPTFPPLTNLAENAIHVTDVQLSDPSQELLNDSVVSVAQLTEPFGINVFLDQAVDPASAQPTTCFVTVDVPYPLKDAVATLITSSVADNTKITGPVLGRVVRDNIPAFSNLPLLGYQPLILPGKVAATTTTTGNNTTNQISWTAATAANRVTVAQLLAALLEFMPALQPTSRLLVHLTLKGAFIWSEEDPELYLDGEAFGVAAFDSNGPRIGLRLPKSGNGKRGSDFEMWFWLVLPVTLTGLSFAPNPVTGGTSQTITGTLNLIGTQLTAGNTIALSVTDANGNATNLVTVPASIQVGTTAPITFQVTNILPPPGGAASANVIVTAAYGSSKIPGTLTINAPITIKTLNFSLNGQPITQVFGAVLVVLTVTLNSPAPPGGAVVSLSSSGPSASAVPASITVPAGATTAAANVSVAATPLGMLTVKATFGSSTQSASLQISVIG